MLNALVVSNGIAGLESYFPSGAGVTYRFARVAPGFRLDLDVKPGTI